MRRERALAAAGGNRATQFSLQADGTQRQVFLDIVSSSGPRLPLSKKRVRLILFPSFGSSGVPR